MRVVLVNFRESLGVVGWQTVSVAGHFAVMRCSGLGNVSSERDGRMCRSKRKKGT